MIFRGFLFLFLLFTFITFFIPCITQTFQWRIHVSKSHSLSSLIWQQQPLNFTEHPLLRAETAAEIQKTKRVLLSPKKLSADNFNFALTSET